MPGAGGLLSPALVAAHLTSYHVNVDPTRGTRPPAGHRDTGHTARRSRHSRPAAAYVHIVCGGVRTFLPNPNPNPRHVTERTRSYTSLTSRKTVNKFFSSERCMMMIEETHRHLTRRIASCGSSEHQHPISSLYRVSQRLHPSRALSREVFVSSCGSPAQHGMATVRTILIRPAAVP